MTERARVARPSRAAVSIGPRLRAARQARGLTLEVVAERAGLTKSFVSRLERDHVSPSVASLITVCDVVGLRVGDLFEPSPTAVVRHGEGAPINFGGTRVEETLLTPGTQRDLQVIRSHILAGGHGGKDLYALPTQVEFVYVVHGRLLVVLEDETVALAAGDCLTFAGRTPHTWRNASASETCDVLWVLAPAP
ncbi:helix-turn-helix domain-containing protein [Aquipuribacter nitratireducens]|uniref:Helix-turn-helix domain-containing protein n=1 Tax=Aquipuribacter nitratireducens TaxID=650104 RepID=A0ABW0GUR1_9MICO